MPTILHRTLLVSVVLSMACREDEKADDTAAPANTPPSVDAVSIEADSGAQVFNDSVLRCTAQVSDAEDGTPQTTTAWTNASTGDALGSDAELTLTPEQATPGDEVVCTVQVEDEAGETASDSTAVTVENRAPVVGELVLSPAAPTSVEEVSCGVEGVSDPDADEVSVVVSWQRDDAAAGVGDAIADPHDVGEVLTCVVTATDAHGSSTVATADVTVVNTDPVVDSVTIEPPEARVGETLTCIAEASDIDETDITVTTTWFDGSVGETYVVQETDDPGDRLTCTATATDSWGQSSEASTDALVLNTEPVLTSVSVAPTEARVGDELTCTASATDADGDSPTITYAWPDGSTASTYTIQDTDDPGDTIACTATATDPDGGTISDAASATVLNTEPTLSVVTIDPADAHNDDTVLCEATAGDADGDTPSLQYAWSGSIAGSLGSSASLDLSTTSVASLETLTCTVTASDPDGGSITDTADLVVSNRSPAVTASLSPSSGATLTDALTCTASATDADDDATTLSFGWTVDGVATTETSATSSSSTLSGAFTKDQEVVCTATATDSKGGSTDDTASTTIENTPPEAPVAEISPSEPVQGEDLNCTVATESTDSDGDTVTYTASWTVDGIAYEAGGASDTGMLDSGDPGWLGPDSTTWPDDTVPGEDVAGGETWTCTLTPDDGDDAGSTGTASVVVSEDDTPCHAIQLTDVDASMSTPATGLGFGTGAWTFEFWIKADAAFSGASKTQTTIMMMNESYSAYAFRAWYYTNTGEVRCYTYNNTSGSHNLDDGYVGVIDDGEWHHIGCSYSGGTMTMFLDGVETGTDTGNPSLSGSSNFVLGEPRSGIYSSYEAAPVQLGPTRISSSARYTADFTPSQSWSVDSDTVAQWLVSDGFDGTTLTDEAGANNDGTVRDSITAVGRCD